MADYQPQPHQAPTLDLFSLAQSTPSLFFLLLSPQSLYSTLKIDVQGILMHAVLFLLSLMNQKNIVTTFILFGLFNFESLLWISVQRLWKEIRSKQPTNEGTLIEFDV